MQHLVQPDGSIVISKSKTGGFPCDLEGDNKWMESTVVKPKNVAKIWFGGRVNPKAKLLKIIKRRGAGLEQQISEMYTIEILQEVPPKTLTTPKKRKTPPLDEERMVTRSSSKAPKVTGHERSRKASPVRRSSRLSKKPVTESENQDSEDDADSNDDDDGEDDEVVEEDDEEAIPSSAPSRRSSGKGKAPAKPIKKKKKSEPEVLAKADYIGRLKQIMGIYNEGHALLGDEEKMRDVLLKGGYALMRLRDDWAES